MKLYQLTEKRWKQRLENKDDGIPLSAELSVFK